MATYEAYVTLGDGSIAISTVEIPLSVQSQTGMWRARWPT